MLYFIDFDDVGFGKFGCKDGYIECQLKCWSIQWEKFKMCELLVMENVYCLFEECVFEQIGLVVVYGDYWFGNMFVMLDDVGVVVVFDWEFCMFGDLMVDVGYLMNDWVFLGFEGVQFIGSLMSVGGFLLCECMMECYVEFIGCDMFFVLYYCVFQVWCFVVIGEGVLVCYFKGVMGGEGDIEGMKKSVEMCVELVFELLEVQCDD